MQGDPLYIPSLLNKRTMKLLTIYSILHISLCDIFAEKKNIMNYNYIGLYLIFTNFFCNIIIKLQEYYITSLLGQNIFCFVNEYVSHVFFSSTQMGTLLDYLSAKAIITDLLV